MVSRLPLSIWIGHYYKGRMVLKDAYLIFDVNAVEVDWKEQSNDLEMIVVEEEVGIYEVLKQK